jgi:hypothetical protein
MVKFVASGEALSQKGLQKPRLKSLIDGSGSGSNVGTSALLRSHKCDTTDYWRGTLTQKCFELPKQQV